ncbi:hypothetical protein, partial [Vibrio sp. V23_P3S9T160]|uniref:hypothetical protein n=1 Tax=Vibrio sp. V23_P3S9T160 TaxID=1938675 RepID=UPI003075B03A
NKRFKRDSQRAAFLLCVGFCGYGVMRKVGSSVVCPLSGRYATQVNLGVQFFGISLAIRFVLSANEHFYPRILGSLKP